MPLFNAADFERGGWAGPLARVLRERNTIPDRHPRARLYRLNWSHWIQVEPKGFSGPAHWLGKPAVMAHGKTLYAGYYVERGLPSHERPEYVLTPEWHWWAFKATVEDPRRRAQLDVLMQNLNPARRGLSIYCGDDRFDTPYQGGDSLASGKAFVESCPPDKWIDLFLGIRLTLDECLTLQGKVRDVVTTALIRGREIEQLVLQAREELLLH